MGSSVDIFCVFCLWIATCEKKGRINHTPQEIVNFPGIFSDVFQAFLRRFLHCRLPQVVLL